MGTGKAASEYFRRLVTDHGTSIRSSKLTPFFVAVCGFESAQMLLDTVLEELNLIVRVHICDILTESDRCFSEKSPVFHDPGLRERARHIASLYGARLEKDAPLGYGDCQAAVVFENNCPNNSLPVLWSESKIW